jgi:hypothetical protein
LSSSWLFFYRLRVQKLLYSSNSCNMVSTVQAEH